MRLFIVMWLLIFEGIVIGCLLGITGAGGGILAVPALMMSQGWTISQAAPVGLLAITCSTFIGSLQGLYKKIVRYRAAIWIAIIGIPSAHYGVYLANLISPIGLSIVFAITMFIVGYRLLSNKSHDLANPPCQIHQLTGRLIWNIKTLIVLGILGLIAGLFTGLLGVGGGFIIVPALRKLTNLDMRSIIATSLMIIFLIGVISIAMHLLQGFQYPVNITISFVFSTIIGIFIGRKMSDLISTQSIQKIFAIAVMCVAIYLIVIAFIRINLDHRFIF